MTDNKSLSQIEIVRETLEKLEYVVARLDECSQKEALEIPLLFDQAFDGFAKLEQSIASFSSEKGVLETISSQFQKKFNLFLQKSGGATVLPQLRQTHNPSQDRWWWYVDQILAERRRKNTLRGGRNIGIAAIALIIFVMVYQKFFAPDPSITASVGHQQQAEMLLANLEFEDAYQEVQNALTYTPNQFDLLILKGVLEELLEKSDQSQESYAIAKDQLENEDVFYAQRSIYYIMAGLPERAIDDCAIAIEINPDAVMAYLNLAQAYQNLGDLQTAYENLELADQAAQRIGNAQLQAIARVQMSQVLQQLSMATPVPLETPTE